MWGAIRRFPANRLEISMKSTRHSFMIGLALAVASILSCSAGFAEAGVSARASVAVHAYAHDVAPNPAANALPAHDVVASVPLRAAAAPSRVVIAQVPHRSPSAAVIHPAMIARYSDCSSDRPSRPPESSC